MSFNKISVVGLGYIGLPTAAVFAARKKHVIGIDVNQHAVDTINRGEIHIVEPELDMVVHAAVTEGFLRASIVPEAADAFLDEMAEFGVEGVGGVGDARPVTRREDRTDQRDPDGASEFANRDVQGGGDTLLVVGK